MDALQARRLRHHLRLAYPMVVVGDGDHFVASHPDLPGCSARGSALPAVYRALELARQAWLRARVLAGEAVPLPNAASAPPRPRQATTQPIA